MGAGQRNQNGPFPNPVTVKSCVSNDARSRCIMCRHEPSCRGGADRVRGLGRRLRLPRYRRTAAGAASRCEWRSYAGDLRNHHYSPLDQINAANFTTLEVAWRFKTDSLGPRPEYKLEGTPLVVGGMLYTTAGTRRAVVALDARDRRAALGALGARRRARRQLAAPAVGPRRGLLDRRPRDERILYVTTGYQLVALDAKTGAASPPFGKDGIVDLKEGVVVGKGAADRSGGGEIGLHATPAITRDGVVLIGSSLLEGGTPKTHNNTKGLRARVRRPDRQAAVDVQHDPAAGRVRQRHAG